MAGAGGFADKVRAQEKPKPIGSMAKGGMVKKTGLYKLHKGEMVMPVKITKKIKNMK